MRHWHVVAVATFQSTLPVWGATIPIPGRRDIVIISIHAPRVGSDSKDAQILRCIFGKGVEYLLLCGRNAGIPIKRQRCKTGFLMEI